MGLDSYDIFNICTAVICTFIIGTRCAYRVFFRCRRHDVCHRQWRMDDVYMAIALLPLAARTVTVLVSSTAFPEVLDETGQAGTAPGGARRDLSTGYKLILVSRICHFTFIWILKACLLVFYSQFVNILDWGRQAVKILWWIIIISYIGVIIATLTECQPLNHIWKPDATGARYKCSQGEIDLVLMASCDVATNVALIVLPFPLLKLVRQKTKKKLQLAFLFGIGLVMVVITTVRVPIVISKTFTQRSRALWASIEILGACIVANMAMFYAFMKEFQTGHSGRDDGPHSSLRAPSHNFELSSSGRSNSDLLAHSVTEQV